VGGQTKLVGRQRELSQLSQIFGDGSASAVLVSGEPGIGKTALMTQVCGEAVARGWRVVTILGVEAEESFALGGLNQVVFALQDAGVRERFLASGADPVGNTPEEFSALVRSEVTKWAKVVKAAGIKPE